MQGRSDQCLQAAAETPAGRREYGAPLVRLTNSSSCRWTRKVADGIQQKAWFCGPPSHVIDGIKSVAAKYPGLEDFMIHWAEGLSPKEFKEQLRWFARDVMPAITQG